MFNSEANLLINNQTTDETYKTLQELRKDIDRRIYLIEIFEILSTILTNSIHEKQNEYINQIEEIDRKRKELEERNYDDSELDRKVDELESNLRQIEQNQDEKLFELNEKKARATVRIEELVSELDFYFEQLQLHFKYFCKNLQYSETCLLTDSYAPIIDDYGKYLLKLQKQQKNCWKTQNLDAKFAAICEENYLKLTDSGTLLTQDGIRITYEEAQKRGYFSKIYKFLYEKTPSSLSESAQSSSTEGSITSQMSAKEVAYLKSTVGRPLTLALAEITAKQPRDPIHYLGCWLIKYRCNQVSDIIQKKEHEELMELRRKIAYQKWKEFVEAEARAAVLDIVARVEQIIYEKELEQIGPQSNWYENEGEEEEYEADVNPVEQ